MITLLSTAFSFIAIAIVAITFLLVSVFFAHTGAFTRFLHRLGFVYLAYYLWLESSGVVFRLFTVASEASLEIIQEDSLYFRLFFIYSTFTLAIFFFGVADRFFLSKMGMLEFPILLLFLHFGGLFALRRHTFRDRLISLERVTLASYVFVTFERQNRFSTYAGVQYFIIGSFPSARLLLSFALFYLQSGSMAFQDRDLFFNTNYDIINIRASQDTFKLNYLYTYSDNAYSYSIVKAIDTFFDYESIKPLFIYFPIEYIEIIAATSNSVNARSVIALFFMLFNFFFKITAAPFHVWAPSVYGKAPIASVTFLSIYSKLLIFFIRYKLRNSSFHVFASITTIIYLFVGIFSIFIGRLGAFSEKQVKSFFVYSSRGHVGFRLIGLGLNTVEGASATFIYLAVYVLTSFVIWFLLLTIGRQKTHLSHFASLKLANPTLSIVFAFIIFSMSGIPPLGGFFVKLDILSAILDNSHFFTNYILFAFTVISFFYYLRVIKIMFFDNQESIRGEYPIAFSIVSSAEYSRNAGRIWIRSIIIIFLSLYLAFIQKPLMGIQYEILSSLYLDNLKLIAQLVRAHAW